MLGSMGTPNAATVATSATPSSPTRPSRLRGLSYLRSYTHNHLHSHLSPSTTNTPPTLARSTSSPGNTTSEPPSAETSHILNAENGWVPQPAAHAPTSTTPAVASRDNTDFASPMTRNRAASPFGPTPVRQAPAPPSSSMEAGPSGSASSSAAQSKETLPTIRFIPHVEARSGRPSLSFTTLSRTLESPHSIVRVGRYSERDNAAPNDPHILPVGFKSKVVSRRHCEFWCTNGQWYIKDVKSSSGTFLNHVRLSPPGQESRPFPVNDGDVVQLGIDFKGGEEVIFRCVKIRVQCNRGWQKSLNAFNTSAHKRILKSAGIKSNSKSRDSDAASVNSSSECSICLNPVAPCQALFVAPCSHVWHYKCVRTLIQSINYPNFCCPNCRFIADLEADVEPPEELDDDGLEILDDEDDEDQAAEGSSEAQDTGTGSLSEDDTNARARQTSRSPSTNRRAEETSDEDLTAMMQSSSLNPKTDGNSSSSRLSPSDALTVPSASSTRPVPIASPTPTRNQSSNEILGARSTTPTSTTQFALTAGVMGDSDHGPMTPRNDAGPFVFDGREDSTA